MAISNMTVDNITGYNACVFSELTTLVTGKYVGGVLKSNPNAYLLYSPRFDINRKGWRHPPASPAVSISGRLTNYAAKEEY